MPEDRPRRPDGGASLTRSGDRDRSGADPPDRGSAPSTAASDLEGRELVIGYPSREAPVIDEASIHVPPGQVTALVGPNGSGKSTLLKGLADQLAPEAGRVLVDGQAVGAMSGGELARELGLLAQQNVAPEAITVEALVGHGRYPHRGFLESPSAADDRAVDRAIDLAGIDHLRDREVGSLSGGQTQLAWVAMVLAQETDVLLLDEPTTFLDLHHQLEVMEVVETLRDDSDRTVVLVLHDIDQAARYADHVVALNDGRVYDRGPPEAVVTEELLADVFRIDAEVTATDHGPRVEPLQPRHDDGG